MAGPAEHSGVVDVPVHRTGAPRAPYGPRRAGGSVPGALARAGGGSLLVGYLSVVVLLPIAALAAHAVGLSIHTHGAGAAVWRWSVDTDLSSFWSTVTQPTALHAIWLSVWLALAVAAVNTLAGVAVAWVLVRDEFPGKRAIESIIDLPFALPTVVVGIVLIFLYGPQSPVHLDLYESAVGLLVALLFVTLPFSVRAVQPVLESLDGSAEAAAATLGASRFGAFRAVVLPSLLPSMLSGFSLAFARAVGEFGAIAFIYGGLGRLTPASAYVFQLANLGGEQGQVEAASVSVALLVLCLAVLLLASGVSHRYERRLSA